MRNLCCLLELPRKWLNTELARPCCLSFSSRILVLNLCRVEISSLLCSSILSMIVSEVKSKLGSSISWVTSYMGTMLPISTSVILWIFLRNRSRGLCRGWHSVKKCCLVSGLVPHTLQVGFTANWLNTALLLWRVYVPVRRRHSQKDRNWFSRPIIAKCRSKVLQNAPIFSTFIKIPFVIKAPFSLSRFKVPVHPGLMIRDEPWWTVSQPWRHRGQPWRSGMNRVEPC